MTSSFIRQDSLPTSTTNDRPSLKLSNSGTGNPKEDEATVSKTPPFHMNGAANRHHHFSHSSNSKSNSAPLLFPVQPQLRTNSITTPSTFGDTDNNGDEYDAMSKRLSAELATFFSPSLLSSSSPRVGRSTTTDTSDQQISSFVHQSSYWNDVTAIALVDILHTLVASSVPQNFVRRQWRRRRRRNQSLQFQTNGDTKQQQQQLQNKTTARGIPNYGQTCFLNSILQALSSLEPFCLYLDRLDENGETNDLLTILIRIIRTINGQLDARAVDPLSLLQTIGNANKQFQSLNAEQQDAQELLQALMSMLVAESDVSVVAEGDSILSLSSFLTQIDLQQQRETVQVKEQEQIMAAVNERNGNDDDDDDDLGEEKKQESSAENLVEKQQAQQDLGSSSLLILDGEDDDDNLLQQASSSSSNNNVMFDSISESTPSPINGWIGSTLQCLQCHHVRPIQNAPFLDIPIVPTSVSSYLNGGGCYSKPCKDDPSSRTPSCPLATCLENFTSVERVTDVECRHCTMQREINIWEDEVFVLQGAVNSLQSRSKLEAGSGVQTDFANAQAHLRRLRSIDADEADSIPAGPTGFEEHHATLCRGDALKCLLLTRLPTVVCLHIQRRYYDPRLDKMAKTIQHVAFDEFMDFGQFCAYSGDGKGMTGSGDRTKRRQQQRVMYKLQSVIEHRGNAFGGHYVAYRRDLDASSNATSWLLVSDESVQPVSWRDVEASQAYMLFYEAIM